MFNLLIVLITKFDCLNTTLLAIYAFLEFGFLLQSWAIKMSGQYVRMPILRNLGFVYWNLCTIRFVLWS